MVVKIIFLVMLLSIDACVADDVVKPPKKFTRSRYSHRKTTTTTNEVPISNYDNSVDLVTDVFSEELLPNKVEEITTTTIKVEEVLSNKIEELATNNPFDSNDTATTTPVFLEELNTSTFSDKIEVTTEEQAKDENKEQTNETNVFPCGEKVGDNHPWIAVLVHTDPTGKSRKKTLSKGVLIDEHHVLTTVSSLHNSRPFWVVSAIRLGDIPVWEWSDNEMNKSAILHVGIKEIFQHKNRDIALIELAENVNFTNAIRPICLPENDQYNFTELYLHICKRSNPSSKAAVVSTVTTSLLSPQDCEIMFRRKKATLTAEEFCVWDETGDSCTGDLGGPLIAMDNGRYSVIGLNSHINSKVKFNCEDYPGIYVRVGSHLPWIKKVTSLNA